MNLYWYALFTPPHCWLSLVVVCQQDMFADQQRLALERWYHLSHMCPGANKPVSLSASSYVTEGRTEEWWRRRFMAPQTTLVRETGP